MTSDSEQRTGPTCPKCGKQMRSLIWGSARFLKCPILNLEAPGCGSVFWWDGPSLLGPKDPQAKRSFTGDFVELNDAAQDKVARL